ncbi:MarR family winged helix-turn-helix transcriptional regulator [Oceanirhabdus seepicola]|uniref:MarR family transcriptional regulator n=1 Tax=Oceanirhabdus seepicola TaxID=2828781 RepID=A0A9J6NYE6_9CLOT|nr:MarR family transcriptional regulator [Oceanirhabdus seepicola]MCM1989466.1 MarR family transcriptional regulator [Oceanirhabdus seepicola]
MDYFILREIGMVARCVNSISDIEFREISLEKGQYLFLVRICENPGINQERLSNMLKVDKTTTAKAVKKLILKGYIIKEQSEKDKRSFKLYPNEKAKEIYEFLRKEEDYTTKNALKDFSDEEKEIAYKLLNKMRLNIEKDWEVVKKGMNRDYLD